MATTHIAFVPVGVNYVMNIPDAPVMPPTATQTLTPIATNTASTAAAPASGAPLYCRVATDTQIYIAFGAAPDATVAGTRVMMPANTVATFRVQPGDKAAVATAP